MSLRIALKRYEMMGSELESNSKLKFQIEILRPTLETASGGGND
jgi:hypothetical protein